MLIRRVGPRIGALLGGGAAVLSGLILTVAGCTTVSDGDAKANGREAPAYRTSVSVSLSQSAASSSTRESERQASLTKQAAHSSCEALSSTSSDAIDAVNAYVGAFNQASGDISGTEGPAIDSLKTSADAVEASITDILPKELKDAFAGWVDGAHTTAKAITQHAPPSEFNQTIGNLNDARSAALRLCDATY